MNMKQTQFKKQMAYIISGFFLILILSSIFNKLVFIKTNKTCGKLLKISTSRYIEYLDFSYIVNGKQYIGSLPKKQLKNSIELDHLRKMDCIEIEYSAFFYSYNRIVDTLVIDTHR